MPAKRRARQALKATRDADRNIKRLAKETGTSVAEMRRTTAGVRAMLEAYIAEQIKLRAHTWKVYVQLLELVAES